MYVCYRNVHVTVDAMICMLLLDRIQCFCEVHQSEHIQYIQLHC